MEIIYQGAESIIYLSEYDNQRVLVKERIRKEYRVPQLDDELRKTRTKKEVKLLTEVRKLGIFTPTIYHVDEKESKIMMEFIDGVMLKNHLNEIPEEEIKSICFELGKIIGKLHSHDIVHGDLTTSNMILKDGKIYLIDFSLGDFTKRIESKGVDLKLLRDALKSTHFKILSLAWESILEGYRKEYKNSADVLEQLKKIEQRVRYANRESG